MRTFKILQIGLASLTTCGAIAVVFTDPFLLKLATAALALVALFVSSYMKGFDPGATAQKHRDTAADLWAIRESYLSLLTDIASEAVSDSVARARRDDLQNQLAASLGFDGEREFGCGKVSAGCKNEPVRLAGPTAFQKPINGLRETGRRHLRMSFGLPNDVAAASRPHQDINPALVLADGSKYLPMLWATLGFGQPEA